MRTRVILLGTVVILVVAQTQCTRDKKPAGPSRAARAAASTPQPAPVKGSYTTADYERHIQQLRKKVPAGFTVVLEPPFVVLGDERPDVVRQRATDTVRWATRHLKADYFSRDPKRIIDVWLFKDATSYNLNTKKIFNEIPSTIFGYYSEANGALIMNIATGGGTLVHELVHPFVEANFPDCPPWFNEGLGSLYEACATRKGRIWGLLNWRLPGLQEMIRQGKVPTFEKLTSMNERQFYTEDRGGNYAQARYLVYYLQTQGKLVPYYKKFLANRKTDPTGYETLVKILGSPDMLQWKAQWENYVLKLRQGSDVTVTVD
ncbi:MAG: hypothetical protein ABI333_26350 [bacterium]